MFDYLFSDPALRGDVTPEALAALFENSGDFTRREVAVGRRGVPGVLCWLDGCVCSAELSEAVLRPLGRLPGLTAGGCLRAAARGGLFAGTVRLRTRGEEAAADLAAGFAALLFPGLGAALTLEVKTAPVRGVESPTIEKSVLGAKDAFVETLRINTGLLRRRLPTPTLKLTEVRVGRRTRTAVAICYIEGVAPPDRASAVRARLEGLDIPGLTAAGELERALVAPPRGVFPRTVHTERPDRFVQGLLRGRVGVLADGLPVGLLVPAALPEMLSVAEDRSRHAAVAGALLWLRRTALLLSLLLPAMYVAAAIYHPEMIPYTLLQSLIRAKEEVPFSTAAEVLGMLVSFELLQEAGIRLPEPVGQTVSVIGALIVGQSAVEAKVLSPIVIIVVAVSGIGGYAQPSQELSAAVRLWRFLLVILAALLGLFGVMGGLMLLLWRLCDTEDLGESYLPPPHRGGALRRAVGRAAGRKEAGP